MGEWGDLLIGAKGEFGGRDGSEGREEEENFRHALDDFALNNFIRTGNTGFGGGTSFFENE